MRNRCRLLSASLVIAAISGATATAQDAARAVPPDPPSYTVLIPILFFPLIFLGCLVILMRRSKKMTPIMDRSLVLAEEGVRLAKEQVELQKETNRLLGQLITARAGER